MQVNSPQSKRKDPLELIMNGLQIAGGILGIRKDMVQTEALQKQQEYAAQESEQKNTQFESNQEEIARRREGRLLPTEELDVSRQFVQVPEGTRDAVKVISPTTGQPSFLMPRPEGTDPFKQKTYDLQKQKLDLDLAKESRENRQKEKEKADEINKEFINNPRTNQYVSSYETAGELKQLLSKKEAVIDAVALRKVFKLSGDVGAIRAEDLQQLGSSPAITDRALAAFNKALDGQVIAPNERKALFDLSEDISANARVKLMKHADTFAARLSNVSTQFNKKKALEYLNPNNLLTDVQGREIQRSTSTVNSQGIPLKKNKSNDDVMNEFLSQ